MSRISHGHPRHSTEPVETCPKYKVIDGTQQCSYGGMHYTDHTSEIEDVRERVRVFRDLVTPPLTNVEETTILAMETAADLLEIHDDTGLSLDNWPAARALVERIIGEPILPNCV